MSRETKMDPDVASIAALLADGSRLAMLDALLAGDPLTSTELARRAEVTAQTASLHLRKLLEAGLIQRTTRGRIHEHRLAGPEVVELLELLYRVARPSPAFTENQRSAAARLRVARTCYDHLAGRFGIAITDALLSRRLLVLRDGAFLLTRRGRRWFEQLGAPVAELEHGTRPLLRACLDWSERRPHLAGSLGGWLARHALSEGWVSRMRDTRALRVTDRGRSQLRERLGVELVV